MDLKDKSLLREQCFVGGEWIGTPDIAVTDPATGGVIAGVPRFGAAETRAAIHEHLAWVGIYRGELAFAATHTRASMDWVRLIADPAVRAESLSTFGMVEFLLGRPAQGLMAEAVQLEDVAIQEAPGSQATVFTASRTCPDSSCCGRASWTPHARFFTRS